ncbi:MAG: C4-dicarboxylate ABC transporter substrate-binding protein [Proteobacteria bacterium]|nr:C4-dicarboxylate ABC transporter substrate-binding protein [Pseudomonadota bacterium]
MNLKMMFTGLTAATALFLFTDRPLQAESAYVMSFGTVAPDDTPWADQLKNIKKKYEAQSNGRIKVKLFLGGSLGSEIEMIQDVQRGERIQGGGFSTGAVGSALEVPLLEMVELPYLFKTNEEVDAVLDEILYEPTQKALEKKNVTFYSWSENGWRNFATKGKVTSPEELKAYKMRCQESSVHLNMYKAMGVQPVPKPVTEVVPSLNTGIVDGFDNTPLFSIAAGWIQPISHYTLSRHIYQPAAVMFSKSFMDSLPKDLQDLILDDPKGEADRGRSSVRAIEKDLIETIKVFGKEVIELTDEQHKEFRKAVRKETHAAFLADNPELQDLYGQVKAKTKSMR